MPGLEQLFGVIMISKEEAESFINAAIAELGPSSCEEWVDACIRVLQEAVSDSAPVRVRPPEYYRPKDGS